MSKIMVRTILFGGDYMPTLTLIRIGLTYLQICFGPKRSGGPVHTHLYSGYLKCKYIIGSDF